MLIDRTKVLFAALILGLAGTVACASEPAPGADAVSEATEGGEEMAEDAAATADDVTEQAEEAAADGEAAAEDVAEGAEEATEAVEAAAE